MQLKISLLYSAQRHCRFFFLMLACDGWYTAKGKEHSAYCAMYIILRTSTIIKTHSTLHHPPTTSTVLLVTMQGPVDTWQQQSLN